jgi:uncharacterized membrane protein
LSEIYNLHSTELQPDRGTRRRVVLVDASLRLRPNCAASNRNLAAASTSCSLILVLAFTSLFNVPYRAAFLALGVLYSLLAYKLGHVLCAKHRDQRLWHFTPILQLKMCLSIILLFSSWLPYLSVASVADGYDPGRYYHHAGALADVDLVLDAGPIQRSNYMGIIYFYGVIFKALGQSPYTAALVNCILTMLAIALLVHCYYCLRNQCDRHDWALCLVAFVPDLVWYDALTSREMLCLLCLQTAILPVGLHFAIPQKAFRPRITGALLFVSLLAVPFLRLWLLLPIALSCTLYAIVFKRGRSQIAVLVILLAVISGAVFLPSLSGIIGGTSQSYMDVAAVYTGENMASFTEGSTMAQYILPRAWWHYIVYFPLRAAAYSAAPLPYFVFIDKGWMFYVQEACGALSGLLFILIAPLTVAPLFTPRNRELLRRWAVFAIPYFCTIYAVSMGHGGVHYRYRVMATGLCIACAWVGRGSSRAAIRGLYSLWFGAVFLGFSVYFSLHGGL